MGHQTSPFSAFSISCHGCASGSSLSSGGTIAAEPGMDAMMREMTAPLPGAADAASTPQDARGGKHESLLSSFSKGASLPKRVGGNTVRLRRSFCAGLVAGVVFVGYAEAASPAPPLSWNQPSQVSPTSPHGDPFSAPARPSEPSAGAVIGTLLAIGVGAVLLGGLLSGEDTASNEDTSVPQRRQQLRTEEDDSEPEPLTGGLYGNCHGGSFYGCP